LYLFFMHWINHKQQLNATIVGY